MSVDEISERERGDFDEPISQVGKTNGLAISMDDDADTAYSVSRFPIQSYLISRGRQGMQHVIDTHFALTDINAQHVDDTTYKGYELAVDYVIRLPDELFHEKGASWREMGWVMKTDVVGNWWPFGGPSASATMAVSIIAALAG